jgi:hypothetical protein
MCSQGAFGGALRCPEYAKDLPRAALIEVLKSQFIRRGFPVAIPADAYDESRWNRDEVAVFFQSGGSVKPRCTLLVEAGMAQPGGTAAPQVAPPPQTVPSADEAARAADFSIPTVRLSLEGRMVRAELLKEELPRAAVPSAAEPAHSQDSSGGGVGGSPGAEEADETDDDDLLGAYGF